MFVQTSATGSQLFLEIFVPGLLHFAPGGAESFPSWGINHPKALLLPWYTCVMNMCLLHDIWKWVIGQVF